MEIKNLNIYGGNQQFADTIINSSSTLDENDRKFIQLIHDNTSNKEERVRLIQSLEDIKDSKVEEKDKSESKGVLKKFVDSGISEAGKQVVKELIENGMDYLQFLI